MKRRAQPWLGTLVDITLADQADGIASLKAFDGAFAEIALVHRLMSFHAADSDVSRINRACAGETIAVHDYTYQVLEIAATLNEVSYGVFNIACAPHLVDWGQLPAVGTPTPKYVPDRTIVRMQEDGSVLKLADGWIDLGGIAKGYAVDLAVTSLQASGINSACVNAGGDLRVFGERDFVTAVRDPVQPTRAGTEIVLRNEAMATSASYFTRKGDKDEQTSALCNGLTGSPIVTSISVSVRAPLCVTADALTKVVLSTGNPEHRALKLFRATAFML